MARDLVWLQQKVAQEVSSPPIPQAHHRLAPPFFARRHRMGGPCFSSGAAHFLLLIGSLGRDAAMPKGAAPRAPRSRKCR